MSTLHPTAIAGVYCAATTPLDADLAPDHASLALHCKALLEEGCDGVAILGTTGEANSFSAAERMEIVDRLVAAGIAPEMLLPGTAQSNIPDTVAMTRHAVDAGVKAVVMLPPFYYKGVSDEGLFAAYARVIDKVARPDLRVILYHIPPISQIPLSPELIGRLIAEFPGIVVGIKDSSGKLESMTGLVAAFPGFSVLSGADPFMLPLLKAGGAGCITASSNLIAADLRIVFDHWNNPAKQAEVEAAQDRIEAWRALTNAYVQLPTVKAMVARRRGNDGWMRVRPPLVALDANQRDHVWRQMAALEAQ